MNDNELARIRNEEIGFVFQTFNLLPRATALHNVELPLVYAGVPPRSANRAREGGAEKVELGVAHEPPAERALRRPAPARGHRPGARQQPVDPARRRADREPRLEDRRRRSWRLFERLHEAGNTIILVTHEADVAAYAHRTIQHPRRPGRERRPARRLNPDIWTVWTSGRLPISQMSKSSRCPNVQIQCVIA